MESVSDQIARRNLERIGDKEIVANGVWRDRPGSEERYAATLRVLGVAGGAGSIAAQQMVEAAPAASGPAIATVDALSRVV